MRVLFVCLGNICRSPTAEAVMRGLVEERGLADRIEIESAGTGDWHIGKRSDPRAIEAAAARGVELTSRARQVTERDLGDFDLIVAMDESNRRNLVALFGGDDSKVRLLREYGGDTDLDVPDPYFGGADGFEQVLDIIERNCDALLDQVSREL